MWYRYFGFECRLVCLFIGWVWVLVIFDIGGLFLGFGL